MVTHVRPFSVRRNSVLLISSIEADIQQRYLTEEEDILLGFQEIL